jgi:hypothetical protein
LVIAAHERLGSTALVWLFSNHLAMQGEQKKWPQGRMTGGPWTSPLQMMQQKIEHSWISWSSETLGVLVRGSTVSFVVGLGSLGNSLGTTTML